MTNEDAKKLIEQLKNPFTQPKTIADIKSLLELSSQSDENSSQVLHELWKRQKI